MKTLEEIYDRLVNAAKDNGSNESLLHLSSSIRKRADAGWDYLDIYNYLRRTETVNPNIPEEKALRLMSEIASKYKKLKVESV